MKNLILLFFATVFCALVKAQPVSVDSATTNWNSVTAYTHVDSGTYYQFELLSGSMVHIANSAQWVVSQDDTLPISETFTGLDTMTAYYVRVNTFPNVTGVPFGFTTDTLITMPVITRDTTVRYPSLGAARLYFKVSGGYDTSWVEVEVSSNTSFSGFGNAKLTYHVNWGGGSGNVYFTGLPQNQILYKRYRVRNSQNISQWLFNAAADTFGLWTTTPVTTYTVTTGDSSASYNTVTVNGSSSNTSLLRLRYGYTASDVSNSGGYVAGITSGQVTTATVTVLPGTTIYYRTEGETPNGTIADIVKSVTSLDFPAMGMPASATNVSYTSTDIIFTPNSGGISIDSFVVTVGQQSFHVGSAGIYTGNQQFQFSVNNLTEGTPYQLTITAYAYGIVAAVSNIVTFTTLAHGTVQTSAASFTITAIQDQVWTNDYYSRVQFQYVSQNLPATVSLKISNDYDTTFTDLPYIISLPGTLLTTDASAVYDHIDILASSLNPNWDQYSIIPGRWVAQLIGANDDNTSLAKSNLYYFFPRGMQTGIRELTSRNAMFINGNQTVFIGDEGGEISIYDLNGANVFSQKILPGEHITLDKNGFYVYQMISITGKTVRGKIFLN